MEQRIDANDPRFYLIPVARMKPFHQINNYLDDDFHRYKESQKKNLDELIDQGVFTESEVDQLKHHDSDE